MDATATSCPTLPLSTDAVNPSPPRGHGCPLRSLEHTPVVAQRQVMKAGEFGSPVRRSPRLSLPPPQPPTEYHDIQNLGENSDASDESESVNAIALHLSRGDTPENDALPPDELSTVLANKIMRAHDNPSPPPQDLAHPDINYVPGKDGRFLLSGVSTPPVSFCPINLLEQLNHLLGPAPNSSRSPQTPTLGSQPEMPASGNISPRGSVSPESYSPFITSVPMRDGSRKDLASIDMAHLSPTECTIPSPLSEREPTNFVDGAGIDSSFQPVAGLGRLATMSGSLESEVFSSSPTPTADSPLNLVAPTPLEGHLQGSPPCPRQQACHDFSPNAKTPPPTPSNEAGRTSLATERVVLLDGQDSSGKELLSVGNDSTSTVREEQETEHRVTNTKGTDISSCQRLDLLSPRPTHMLARLSLSLEPTSLIGQPILPADSIPIKNLPATPLRTPRPFVTHPDSSRSTARRLVIIPTPVRADNGLQKPNSPTKSSFGVDDIHRTPAQRVPIESAFARGTPSLRRTVQLSMRPDDSQLGRFPTIRAPVFARPALDGPSRSPAKRVPIPALATSPATEDHTSHSPTRLALRTRSASVEPRPLRPILARSQSVEPCTIIPKPDNHEKIKEFVFPAVSVFPKSGTKLPFPLVCSQKSSSDHPPPIPEEHETAEIGNTEIGATLCRVTQYSTMSQLRQPPTNSRIPRIGSKPYARPPAKNGKATVGTTAAMACVPSTATFQLARRSKGVGSNNTETSAAQPANDRRLIGSLKRKRGAEAALSNSHPVMIRQVVPGVLSGKRAPKSAVFSHVQSSSPLKVPQSLKFRKVVDGMLLARYAPAKASLTQMEPSDPASHPLSPLSELSSSSNEEPSDEKLPTTTHLPPPHKCEASSFHSRTNDDASVAERNIREHPLRQDADDDKPSARPRRTSRTRKSTQQQYILDVFSSNTPSRPPPARRKPQSRMEGDRFMGMSATALKALTTFNTTRNQQTVAVLATEVIRKEGLRPESPIVKARTILQKQQDERDMRRKERALKKAQMNEGFGPGETEGGGSSDQMLLGRADHDQNNYAMPPKHRRGPGDEEDYETPERPERIVEPMKLERVDTNVKPVKQVKWHQRLLTAVRLDEVAPRSKSLPKDVVVRGCLAPTSKSLPLDPLGNLVDTDNRPSPELLTEQIVVKRYLYDNDIEPAPVPVKATRSKSKKSKS